MYKLKIEQLGEDFVLQLPPELLAKLSCAEGDTLTVEIEDGKAILFAGDRIPAKRE